MNVTESVTITCRFLGVLLWVCCLQGFAQAQTIPNAGFENDLTDWTPKADHGMSSGIPEAARTGTMGVRINDERPDKGSWLESLAVEVEAGKKYELSFWLKTVSGEGNIEVSTQFFDEAGKRLLKKSPSVTAAPSAEWKRYSLPVTAPTGAVGFIVIVRSTAAGVTTANLDDFEVKQLP